MTQAYLLTIRGVSSQSISLQSEECTIGLGDDYTMCALHLNETSWIGGLNDILAIPPAVRVGIPEWRVFVNRDYDAPQ